MHAACESISSIVRHLGQVLVLPVVAPARTSHAKVCCSPPSFMPSDQLLPMNRLCWGGLTTAASSSATCIASWLCADGSTCACSSCYPACAHMSCPSSQDAAPQQVGICTACAAVAGDAASSISSRLTRESMNRIAGRAADCCCGFKPSMQVHSGSRSQLDASLALVLLSRFGLRLCISAQHQAACEQAHSVPQHAHHAVLFLETYDRLRGWIRQGARSWQTAKRHVRRRQGWGSEKKQAAQSAGVSRPKAGPVAVLAVRAAGGAAAASALLCDRQRALSAAGVLLQVRVCTHTKHHPTALACFNCYCPSTYSTSDARQHLHVAFLLSGHCRA